MRVLLQASTTHTHLLVKNIKSNTSYKKKKKPTDPKTTETVTEVFLITGPWNLCGLVVKKDMVIKDLMHRLLWSKAETEKRNR
jgi:hypothetical protein